MGGLSRRHEYTKHNIKTGGNEPNISFRISAGLGTRPTHSRDYDNMSCRVTASDNQTEFQDYGAR